MPPGKLQIDKAPTTNPAVPDGSTDSFPENARDDAAVARVLEAAKKALLNNKKDRPSLAKAAPTPKN